MADTAQKKPGLFARLHRFAKRNGIRCTIYQTLNRLANAGPWRRLFQVSIVNIYAGPLTSLKKSDRLPKLYEVRPAGENDFEALGEYCGNADQMKVRIERGDMCMLNLCKKKIGAMMWFSLGPNQYNEDWAAVHCQVRFPKGTAWMFDGKGTRLGAWGGMMVQSNRILEEMGVEEVYTMVDWENRNSIDPMISLGLEQTGSYMFIKFFGLNISRCKTSKDRRWRRLPVQVGRLEVTKS